MIEVPTDQLIFIRVRLFLNRIIENEHPVFALDGAHHGFDLMPELFRRVLGLRQKARHWVVADLAI